MATENSPKPLSCDVCGVADGTVSRVPIRTATGHQRVPRCPEHQQDMISSSKPQQQPDQLLSDIFGPKYSSKSFDNFYTGDSPAAQEAFDQYNSLLSRTDKSEDRYTGEMLSRLQKVKQDLQAFSHEMVKTRDGRVLLTAPTGAGKSHLAAAMVRVFCRGGLSVEGISAFEFVEEMLDTMNSRYASEQKTKKKIIARLVKADALIIEDLNPNTFTETTRRYFHWLFKRLTERQRILVVTSEKPQQHLEMDSIGVGQDQVAGLGKGAMDLLKEPPGRIRQWKAHSFRVMRSRLYQDQNS